MKVLKPFGYFLYVFVGSWLPHYQLGHTWFIAKKIRQASAKMLFDECGKKVDVGRKIKLNNRISIGNRSSIGDYSFIQGKVKIGDDVMIAPQVMIIAENHNFDDLKKTMNQQGSNEKGIVIENNVWVGARAIILDGVTIKSGSVIAAGAVVTKSTEPNSVIGGVPAKLIKKRGTK